MDSEAMWQDFAVAGGVKPTDIRRRERLVDRAHAVTQEVITAFDEYHQWLDLMLKFDPRAREFQDSIDVERVFDAMVDWERMMLDSHKELQAKGEIKLVPRERA